MRRMWTITLLMVMATGVAPGPPLLAAPTAPVRLEYQRPRSINAGDEVTMPLTFRALADLDQLDVSIAPDGGLELLSETTTATFQNIPNGDARTFQIRVRITGPKEGNLAIAFKTRRGQRRESSVSEIVFPIGKD